MKTARAPRRLPRLLPALAVAVGLSAAGPAACGEIYKWVDRNGALQFGDRPPPGQKVEPLAQDDGAQARAKAAEPAAAPYTREAYDRLVRAGADRPPPEPPRGASARSRCQARLAWSRERFRACGYDYDATLRAVARDFRYRLIRIPDDEVNAVAIVFADLERLKAGPLDERSAFPGLLDVKTADAVIYIWANAGAKEREKIRQHVEPPPDAIGRRQKQNDEDRLP